MNSNNLTNWRDCLALLFLTAMVLWFGHEIVWDGKVPFFRDLGTFFYPMRFSLAESLRAGELPLWDRRMAMGFPLLANFQSGSFYPPHFLFLLFPFFAAIRLLFLFHYLVAATGTYALCRRWNYPPYLALIGGLLFSLGGTIVSLTNLLNHFQAAVWLPWVIFFWERSLRSRSWKAFLSLSFVLLVQFLAGSPEIYGMSLGLLFLDGLRLKAEEEAMLCRRIFFHLLAANVLVAGLAMVQILPTIELFLESRARASFPYAVSIGWSLHPLSFLNFFFLDKEVAPDTPTGLQLFFSRDVPLIISLYLGAIALPAAALWLWQSSLKEKAVLIGLIVASVILALGGYTPVYRFLYQTIPLVSLIRFPEKFLFVTYVFFLFVTLRGLFRFFHPGSSIRAPFLILSSIWLLYIFLYLILRTHTAELAQFIASATQASHSSPSVVGKTTTAVANVERQVILVSGIVLLLLIGKRGAIGPALFKTLLVAVAFLDLYSAHEPYQYLLDPNVVDRAPRVLASADSARLFFIPRLSHLHPDYFFSSKGSLDARVAAFYSNFLPNTGIINGYEYVQEIDPLERWPYRAFLKAANALPPEKLYRLLGALNVGHLISTQPLAGKGITLVRQFSEYPTWLYRVDQVVPRVFVASEAVVERDPVKSIELLSSEKFDPFREVILEGPQSITASKHFQAQAEIVKYTNRQVTVAATVSGPGILVLADSYYPGWKVYVDGKESQILRADLFFRGVLLSPGKHLVEFRYHPNSFLVGFSISLATLFGIGFYSIFSLYFYGQEPALTRSSS